MSKHTIHRNSFRNAARACGIALLISGSPVLAQSVAVAKDSLEFTPDTAKKELAVGLRLVDDVKVISVQAASEGKGESLPATWEAWDGDKAPACAWMIVVDSSNTKRAKTIAKCVEAVGKFVDGLPKQDKVTVCTLALNLSEVVPFGSTREAVTKGLAGIKPAGDASQTTLIYLNLRNGLGRLTECKEPRKAVLLLTDGKDESPGGAAAQEIEKSKLIKAAKDAGIVVHTLGYAESARAQVDFAPLKDISAQTDGLFRAAALDGQKLPEGTLSLFSGVMHGAGVVHIVVKELKELVGLTVTVKTALGNTAVLQVPRDKVAAAKAESPDEIAAAKKMADEEAAKVAKAKADEEKKTADEENAKKTADDAKAAKVKADADQAAADQAAADQAAADKTAKEKTDANKAAAKQKQIWIAAGSGVALLVVVVVLLMVRKSRQRAAEEARLAEEERAAQDARRAAEARRQAEETKKVEAPPLAWLEMCDAQQTRHPVRITSLKIGRGQHNDLVLRNDSVSGNHCVINCSRDKEWNVTDLNSGNGIVLNGSPVKQASLRHGDVIELGELKMRFLLRA
ncbi:MAG: FHA domain-containing protein [Verrucomicrobiota bacterium]